jgi:hypothetical protein
LECWNAGILEEWVLGYWNVGLMVRRNQKIIMEQHPLKRPLFHPSSIPIFHDYGKKLKSQKIPHIFIELQKFRDVKFDNRNTERLRILSEASLGCSYKTSKLKNSG